MKNGNITSIDRAGRIVVPKALREQAGLVPGARLSIHLRGGHLELAPEPRAVELERRGSLLVAVPAEDATSLSTGQVRDTLEQIRQRKL